MQKMLMIVGALALVTLGGMFMMKDNSSNWSSGVTPVMLNEWKLWKSKYTKNYVEDMEEAYRFHVWMNNLKYILENQGVEYTLALNGFADLTAEEFRSKYLMEKGVVQNFHTEETAYTAPADQQVPSTVDWVAQGKTISVLDQGQCGSCWAFSTVESIESAYAVSKNVTPVPNLSEQQVVSCSLLYGELGCNGGNVVPAYKYVMAHPLTTNTIYPYTSGNSQKTGICNTSLQNQGTWKVTGYKTVPSQNCQLLQSAAATTPVSVCVDAANWQLYSSGVFSSCGTQLDHCVLLTGYVENQYWTIQNSWTTQWGEQGFIQLKWGNTCGVCQQAQIPLV